MNSISTVPDTEHALRVPAGGGVLVFDGYCGFCTRAVRAVLRHDRRSRVRALPLQGPRVLQLAGLTEAAALHEAWWIGADGRRSAGAAAMLAATSAATGLPLTGLLRSPAARWAAERIYRWVAEHRRLLPGATPHCVANPTADCLPQPGASCGTGGR
jgi:predicted DCC family thiol-disulfide oxidoreductase YuxK